MSKADVEAKLKADLKLMEISLTEESKWKYAGTGKSEDGAHWTITVAQSENELKWTNENDRGVKGTGSFRYQGTGPVGSVPGSGSSGFRTR